MSGWYLLRDAGSQVFLIGPTATNRTDSTAWRHDDLNQTHKLEEVCYELSFGMRCGHGLVLRY